MKVATISEQEPQKFCALVKKFCEENEVLEKHFSTSSFGVAQEQPALMGIEQPGKQVNMTIIVIYSCLLIFEKMKQLPKPGDNGNTE